MSRAARLNGFHNTDHRSDAAAPTRAWLGWHHRLGHGRQQPDDFHHHGAVHRPGRHSRTRQRGGAAAHRRRAARLGRGAGVDRVGADVAQSRGRHLGRVRRSLPALQPRPRRADRHLLLVGLDPDLRSDRAPFRGGAAALVLARRCRWKRSPSPSCCSSPSSTFAASDGSRVSRFPLLPARPRSLSFPPSCRCSPARSTGTRRSPMT